LGAVAKKDCNRGWCNVGALLVYDSKSPLRPHIITVNLDPVQKRNYDEYYGRLDPLAPTLARTPAGVVVSNCAVTNDAQRRGEFYNDWAYPNEMGDNIVVNILDSTDGPCTLAIAHPSRSELFATPEVLRLVNLLVPHLRRALKAQLDFGPLSLIRNGALDLVEHWRHGCVLVSFAGQSFTQIEPQPKLLGRGTG